MANTKTLAAVHTHTHTHTHTHIYILLKNEKNTRVIETVANNAVLVCYAKLNKKANKKTNFNINLNNKKHINSRNKLCKFIKLLDEKSNSYCKCA